MANRDIRPSKEENTTKRTRRSWPLMDYTLPSERNKESREERKLKAEGELIERQSKKGGSKKRPSASSDSPTKEEKKKGKERDEKIPSSGPKKRKAESEDEDGCREVYRKRRGNLLSSPVPSLATVVSPMTDDTTHATPVPASGKKELLLRSQESMPDRPPHSRTPRTSANTSAIVAPPPHSVEVDKLRQKLTKSEDMYKRACQKAREEQLRAERAEKLLDTKPPREVADWSGLEKELEKRLSVLKAQLDEARKEIDHEQSKKQEKAREIDSLKIELTTSRTREEVANRGFKDLKDELETAKIAAAAAPTANELDVARRENAALKAELEAEKAKVAEIPNIRNEAAEEIAALTKSLETSRRLEEVANDKNDVLSRENLLLKEALAEKRK